jgi:hypothetical protein
MIGYCLCAQLPISRSLSAINLLTHAQTHGTKIPVIVVVERANEHSYTQVAYTLHTITHVALLYLNNRHNFAHSKSPVTVYTFQLVLLFNISL